LCDHFQPDCGFVEFLEHDAQLVYEVLAAFRAPSFAVVGGDGGAGAEDLAADVTALLRSGKFCGKGEDPCGKED